MKKLSLMLVSIISVAAIGLAISGTASAWSIIKDNTGRYSQKNVVVRCNSGAEKTIMYLPSCSSKPWSTGWASTCDHATLSRAASYACGE